MERQTIKYNSVNSLQGKLANKCLFFCVRLTITMVNKNHEGVLMVRGRGTGFLSLPDFSEDVVIERADLGFALDKDLVKIELLKRKPGERQRGKVLVVLKSAHPELIGTVKSPQPGTPGYHLVPDNRRIHVRPQLPEATKTHADMKVVVELGEWKNPHLDPPGIIKEVLGPAGDHETEMRAIIRGGGFTENFPPSVNKAAQALALERDKIFSVAVAETKKSVGTRRDLRHLTTMTIDPHDAKDFDDAISVRRLQSGQIELGVHIADVSHYVRPGGALDQEAGERGTSIYLVDRVIPMLPEILSNDLCSLRPQEDKLAFSAIFEIADNGLVVSEWFGQTIIHSDKRFSYEEAQAVLDNDAGELLTELKLAMQLSQKLRRERYHCGAIAFEQPEVAFKLDEKGKPLQVYTKTRIETMLMIEDFMLLANQRVAAHIHKLCAAKGWDAAFVYRVHDTPDCGKIEALAIFLRALGYEFETKGGLVKATDINKLLQEVTGKPEENLIKTATIRSMAKAVYSTKNIGHFGLAFKFYTHFTSPIRRYPDLMVHRLLRQHLAGWPINKAEMVRTGQLAIQSSEREMEAVRAERDSIKFKQVEYWADHIGAEFSGIITGVTDRGIYVEEKESKAEGMIRLSTLKDDYYVYEAAKYRVQGERSGREFSLGQEVKVKLVRADTAERQLDFVLAD